MCLQYVDMHFNFTNKANVLKEWYELRYNELRLLKLLYRQQHYCNKSSNDVIYVRKNNFFIVYLKAVKMHTYVKLHQNMKSSFQIFYEWRRRNLLET